MRTIHIITALTLIALAACGDREKPEDSGLDTQDTQDSTPPEDTGPEQVAPTIESGTWQCSKSSSGPHQIIVLVEADDPQGDDTLDPMGAVVELYGAGDDPEASFQLICDDDGSCSGSFEVTWAGMPDCSVGKPHVSAVATVTDEDGNGSEPCTLTWLDTP